MKRSAALSSLLLFLSAFLLYRKGTRLWWTYDDPWFLHVALARRWTEGFTHADIWRQNLFTPLLTLTYEALAAMFGVEPYRWYVAQVVVFGLVAIALFAVLRLYVDTVAAFGGALLFLAGPPLASAAAALGVIHYFEAILFGILATIAFVISVRRDVGRASARHGAESRAEARPTFSVLSALFYLVAMLAKEIAVPLVAVLAILPEGNFRTRAKHLIPHAIALATYTAWRLIVIGLPISGYGWALEPRDLPRMIATLPWKLITATAGTALAIGIVMIALTAAGAARALRTRRTIAFALAALLLGIAPIIPVSREMQDRYALLPWLWLCCAFAIGVATLKRREIVIAAAIVIALIANRQEWAAEFGRNIRMSDEARVWVAVGGDAVLRKPAIPPGTMPELQWLKEDFIGHDRGALWFYDDFYLCANRLQNMRVWEYSPAQRMVVEATQQIPEIARRYCSSLRNDVPLRTEFHYRGDALRWRFGPYENGRWGIILLNGEHSFVVPRESAFHLGPPGISLRVRYESPEGWITYSPEIALDFARQPDFVWHR